MDTLDFLYQTLEFRTGTTNPLLRLMCLWTVEYHSEESLEVLLSHLLRGPHLNRGLLFAPEATSNTPSPWCSQTCGGNG